MGTVYCVNSDTTYTGSQPLRDALTGESGNFPSEQVIFEPSGVDNANVTIPSSGYASGILIRPPSDERANGRAYNASTNEIAFFDSTIDLGNASNVTISGYAIRNIQLLSLTSGSSNVIENCDLGHNSSGADTVLFNPSTQGIAFNNCILRDAADDGFYSATSANTNVTADKCTVVDAARYGLLRLVATDCLVLESGTGDFLNTAAGSDYNASSDSSAPGANSLTSRTTADVVDYAGGDFNLASGSALQTAGSDGANIGAILEAQLATKLVTLDTDYADFSSASVFYQVGAVSDLVSGDRIRYQQYITVGETQYEITMDGEGAITVPNLPTGTYEISYWIQDASAGFAETGPGTITLVQQGLRMVKGLAQSIAKSFVNSIAG